MLKSENNPKVLAAITDVVKQNREAAVQVDEKVSKTLASRYNKFAPVTEKKEEVLAEELSPKQKKIAKVAGHPKKIDAADFKALRSGAKVDEALHPNQQKIDVVDDEKIDGKDFAKLRAMKKAKSKIQEKKNRDTPGQHQCAIHVKNEQWGEGKTITSQHAEPDAEGNIAWYDVMFEHGVEKQVPTSNLEILVSESHGNHKKMAEETELDEARGRPRKNPAPASSKDDHEYGGSDSGKEPDQHIHVQLSKASDMTDKESKGGADVKFDNGSHFVHAGHAKKVLDALAKLKPADREKMHSHIQQSHANFQAVHKLVS